MAETGKAAVFFGPGQPFRIQELPVHPLYAEQVEVVERYGRHAQRVEQPHVGVT